MTAIGGYDTMPRNRDNCDTPPDSKVHGANMGPIWGQHDPGGPHVGPMNFVIWAVALYWLNDIKDLYSLSDKASYHQRPLLLIWFNFIHSMDKWLHPS